jgi:hypothetical protein
MSTENRGMTSTCILVLGMHRSGTSALTRCLNLLGMDLGSSLIAPEAMNSKGFWEHADAVRINNELFQSFGMYWRSLGPLPDGWLTSAAATRAKEEIAQLIKRDFSDVPLWGIKDPRICRLAPLWLEVLRDLGIATTAVITLRSPLEVAASLAKAHADLSDIQLSVFSWMQHVAESEIATRGLVRAMIEYDDLMSDPETVLSDIGESLNVQWPMSIDNRRQAIRGFLDLGLRTHRKPRDDDSTPLLVRRMIDACGAITRDKGRGDWSQLSAVADEVKETTRLIGTMEAMYRHIAGQSVARATLYFADDEDSLSEHSTIYRDVPYGRSQLEFWLPHGGSKRFRFRLDPIDRHGCCLLRSIVLINGNGQVVWDMASSMDDVKFEGMKYVPSFASEGERLSITDSDPRIWLNWPESMSLEGLRLKVDIERMSDAALCMEVEAADAFRVARFNSVTGHESPSHQWAPSPDGQPARELEFAQRNDTPSLETGVAQERVLDNLESQKFELGFLKGRVQTLADQVRGGWFRHEQDRAAYQSMRDELMSKYQHAEDELASARASLEQLSKLQAEQAAELARIRRHWSLHIFPAGKE